jgi:hypothetical protein
MERQYIPRIDTTFKMRDFTDYTARGINVWAHLKTVAVTGETVSFQVLDGNKPTNNFSACPLSAVNPPIGWESRYTIYCSTEQAEKIISNWFARGIMVRANHCIGDSAGSVFQPLDNSSTPHWKYPECTEAIPADLCPKLFRVVSVLSEEINHYSNPEHPNLRQMKRTERAKAIKAMQANGWQTEYVPYAGGFWTRRKETVLHNWQD